MFVINYLCKRIFTAASFAINRTVISICQSTVNLSYYLMSNQSVGPSEIYMKLPSV